MISRGFLIWHVACYAMNVRIEGKPTMYDSRFFRSRLGKAAAISIAAMLAFNLLTLSQQLQATPLPLATIAAQPVEIA